MGLCHSDHYLLAHPPDQGSSPLIGQFGQAASSRKIPHGFQCLPFKNDGGHHVLLDLQHCNSSFTFPCNPILELYRQFLQRFFYSHYGILYRQLCTFPNNVHADEFTTSGHKSSCRNITGMKQHQSSAFSV